MDDKRMQVFAEQLRAAISSGDPALIGRFIHTDARVWENTDQVERTLEEVNRFHGVLADLV